MAREYEGVAKALASRGRGGDSMLMHVNPLEVEIINQLAPGRMTINPDTGQPEALWFLAPLLALAGAAAPAAGAATGAGLATTLAASTVPTVFGSSLGALAPSVGAAVGTGAGTLGTTGSLLGAGGSVLGAGGAGAGTGAGAGGGLMASLTAPGAAFSGGMPAGGLMAGTPAAVGGAGGAGGAGGVGNAINSGIQYVLNTVGETVLNTIAAPYELAGGALESLGAVPAGSWSGPAGAAGAGAGGGIGESAALGADAATLPASATTPMSMQQGLGALGGQTQAGQALLANQGLIQSVPSAAAPTGELVAPVAQGLGESMTPADIFNPADAAEAASDFSAAEFVEPAGLNLQSQAQHAAEQALTAGEAPSLMEYGQQALDYVGELPGEALDYLGELPGEALEYAKEAPGKIVDFVKNNPLEAGMMGLTVGSAIADSGGGGDEEEELEYDPDARLDSEWSSGDMESYDAGSTGDMVDRWIADPMSATQDPLVQGIADVPDTGEYDYETLGSTSDFGPREDSGLAQLSAFDPSGGGTMPPSASVAQISPDEYPRLQAEFTQMNPDGTIEEFERWLLERGYGGGV